MGNCSGKKHQKTESYAQGERRKIQNAQDRFVRQLVNTTEAELDDMDGDSVGPDLDPDEVFPLLPTEEVDRRKSLHRLKKVVSQAYDDLDSQVVKVDLTKYKFPFENLVFEGGGNKGLAYCGAVRVLEELGVWPQIKRFAGSSAGGMTASLLAVGYNSSQIEEFLSQDLSKIFLDHSCGYFSLLPNLIKGYGWNPGKKIFHWFGNALCEQTGNADITFSEIYEKYGKELCIVVTNLNMMNAEYFHPKTTPDTPVRVAVRMSMAIPGLFQATQYETYGQENTYVDGGVLCNYPIHCYDGWWLSMSMKDSFLNKLQPLENFPKLFEKKERFGSYNDKTLGFLLYADNERDILRDILEQRVGAELSPFPDTKLAKHFGREKMRKKKLQEKVKLEHIRNLHAVSAFLKVLNKHNEDADDKINKPELEKALKDEVDFPRRYCERLFGKNVTVEEAMAALDENGDGEIKYNELVHFIERTGVSLQARFLGYQRKEIKGLFSFFDTLQSALLTNIKRIFVEERDIDRTVGINTGHVGTSDFVLEKDDREFVVEQGRRSTESFLRYYVVKNKPPLKSDAAPTAETLGAEELKGLGKTISNGGSNHILNTEAVVENANAAKEVSNFDQTVKVSVELINIENPEDSLTASEATDKKGTVLGDTNTDTLALIEHVETESSKDAFAIKNELVEESTVDTKDVVVHEKETSSKTLKETSKG